MIRLVARLAVLVVGALCAMAWSAPATATGAAGEQGCTCESETVDEDAAAADAVFSGTVRETRSPDAGSGEPGRGELLTHVVDVDTVYKAEGTVVTETVRVMSARQRSTCGLGVLPAGTAYLFFARARDAGFRSDQCDGSRPADDTVRADVEAVLGPGEEMTPESETPELELTRVESAAPRSASRLAAPGAAITLVGVLGLILVRLAGSRR